MDSSQDTALTGLNDQLPSLTSSLTDALAPVMLLSIILSVIFVIAYLFSMFRRWKVEKAILSMQKDIHEINERERSKSANQTTQPHSGAIDAEPLLATSSVESPK